MDDAFFRDIAKETISDFLEENKKIDRKMLNRYILDNIAYRLDDDIYDETLRKKKRIMLYLLEKVDYYLTSKRKLIDDDERFDDFVRTATLTSLDNEWVEEVDYLGQLQTAVSGRSTAQRNPVYEYQNDALESYRRMEKKVYKNILRNVLLSTVSFDDKGNMNIIFP